MAPWHPLRPVVEGSGAETVRILGGQKGLGGVSVLRGMTLVDLGREGSCPCSAPGIVLLYHLIQSAQVVPYFTKEENETQRATWLSLALNSSPNSSKY